MKAQEKIQKVVEKSARAATKEANRKFKDKWTTTAIEEAGEKLHEAIRERRPISDHMPFVVGSHGNVNGIKKLPF